MDVDYPIADGFLDYAIVLGGDFTAKAILDTFTSFVWTERYRGYGDFEMVMPVSEKIVRMIDLDDYLAIKESNALMVIESMTLDTDEDTGADTITISGRSLECLLERRIVWYEVKEEKETNFQALIKKLLDQNAINPNNENRILTGLKFKESESEAITSLTTTLECLGDNLYGVIDDLCGGKNLGFRVLPEEDGKMAFELYFGVDRSSAQEENVQVTFSNAFENLLTSSFLQSEINYVSNALVNAKDVLTMEVYRKPERTGLKRREMYINVSMPTSEDGETSNVDEKTFAFDEAKKTMSEHTVTVAFGSDVAPMMQFQFGVDYFVGDIVNVENRYGFGGRCRIDEIVRSRDEAGPVLTPTFVAINEDNEEVKE